MDTKITFQTYTPNFSGRFKLQKKVNLTKEGLEECFKQGLTIGEISQKYNTTATTVYNYVKQFKLNYLLKHSKIDVSELVSLVREGKTAKEIAKILNTDVHNVYYRVRTLKLPLVADIGSKEKIVDISLLKKYLNEGKSVKEIAKLLNISPSCVYARMNDNGLARCIVNIEQENLCNSILELVNEGFGIKEITKKLNITTQKVQYWIKKLTGKNIRKIRKEKIVELLNQNYSIEMIAQKMKLTEDAVYYTLKHRV